MKLIRNLMCALVCVFVASAANAADAVTDYPDKTIRLVVPFGAGGTTDLFGRIIAQALNQELGVAVVVENRAGAGGSIGSAQVARAQPDGYTLLLGGAGHLTILPSLDPAFPFDAANDLEPVMMVGTAMNVLVAAPDLPVTTTQGLIDHARKNPDGVNYASGGIGGVIHLAAEMFAKQADLSLTHIPYKGSAAVYPDLISGRVQIMFDNLPSALPYIQNQQVKPLAVTGTSRSPQLPDVPMISEEALKDYEASSWWGVFAPAGTPAPIIAKLSDALAKGMKPNEEEIRQLGAEPAYMTSLEFKERFNSDSVKWAELIESADISLD